MIFPEIFNGKVMGFYSDRDTGTDVSAITGRRVYFPIQKHTDKVIEITDDLTPVEADAVVTGRHDIMLGVKTADCVPILLFDPVNLIVAAVHAGWRGTAAGILKKTIEFMISHHRTDPARLIMSTGPAIRWCCYTVGRDVLDAVAKATGLGDYHKEKDGKLCLDLPTANKYQALSMGLREVNIGQEEECTFCYPERYFSYRYDPGTPERQGGFIGMP